MHYSSPIFSLIVHWEGYSFFFFSSFLSHGLQKDFSLVFKSVFILPVCSAIYIVAFTAENFK